MIFPAYRGLTLASTKVERSFINQQKYLEQLETSRSTDAWLRGQPLGASKSRGSTKKISTRLRRILFTPFVLVVLTPEATARTLRISRCPDGKCPQFQEIEGEPLDSRDLLTKPNNKSDPSIPFDLNHMRLWLASRTLSVDEGAINGSYVLIPRDIIVSSVASRSNASSSTGLIPSITCIPAPGPPSKSGLSPLELAGIILAAIVIGGPILTYLVVLILMPVFQN